MACFHKTNVKINMDILSCHVYTYSMYVYTCVCVCVSSEVSCCDTCVQVRVSLG